VLFKFFNFFQCLSPRPKQSSDVPADASSDLPTSQPTPQAIFQPPSWCPKMFYDVLVDAERNSSVGWDSGKKRLPYWRLREIFRWPQSAPQTDLPTSQSTPKKDLRLFSRRRKRSFDVLFGAPRNHPTSQSAPEKIGKRQIFWASIKSQKVTMKMSPFACSS